MYAPRSAVQYPLITVRFEFFCESLPLPLSTEAAEPALAVPDTHDADDASDTVVDGGCVGGVSTSETSAPDSKAPRVYFTANAEVTEAVTNVLNLFQGNQPERRPFAFAEATVVKAERHEAFVG